MFQSLINRFQTLPAGWREATPYLLLTLAVFAAYANVYNDAFLLDDPYLVVGNKFLRDWRYLPDIFTHLNYAGADRDGVYYRPLVTVLHLILYQIFGLSKPAFHALNIALQALNAGLVYKLGRKLGFGAGAVFSAALLWCVHPLNTQDITYISSMPELICAAFMLTGLLTLLPDFTPRKICLSLPFFLLALGSKESAVVFPALAVACLFIVSKNRLKPATYIKTWPFWLISAADAAIWLLWSTHSHMSDPQDFDIDPNLYTFSLINRIFTSLATLPVYFSLMVWPTGLHFPRSFPIFTSVLSWQVLCGMVLVIGALTQIILGKGKRGLPLSFGLFWFAATLSPYTGIVIPIDAMISEGWLYVPSIGLALGVAQTLSSRINKPKFKTITAVVVTVAALSLGVKSYSQNQVYQNQATLYENIFSCGEDFANTHNNLGIYYLGQNEFDKAIEQFKHVVARPGTRPPPMMAGLYINLAVAYLRVPSDENGVTTIPALVDALPHTHQIPEAVEALNKALEYAPDSTWARQFLDIIHAYQKNGGDK